MKYLIILAVLIMGCEETKIASPGVENEGGAWCTVEKWNNGDLKGVYVIGEGAWIDSTRGDTLFITSSEGKVAIVDNPYGIANEVLKFNEWYDFEISINGHSYLYHESKPVERCID